MWRFCEYVLKDLVFGDPLRKVVEREEACVIQLVLLELRRGVGVTVPDLAE